MIFDIDLMGTPSFLEGSSVYVFPFAPPDGVTAERAANGSGPDDTHRIDDGVWFVRFLLCKKGLVGDEVVLERQGRGIQLSVPERFGTLPRSGASMMNH
jgi:hypothetical protein